MTREEAKREEAKRTLEKLCYNSFWFEGLSLSEKLAIKTAVLALSVPEREKGDWIRNGSHILAPVYRCSNCNKRVAIIWGEEYKCCPNCKADMRGKINPEYKFEIEEENNETDN